MDPNLNAEQIRQELGAPSFAAIIVGRLPGGELFGLRFGPRDVVVNAPQFRALIEAGARDVGMLVDPLDTK